MKTSVLPEGRLLHTKENEFACSSLSVLQQALEKEQILEGIALSCVKDEGIQVSLGTFSGFIPWTESAIGISDGTTKDIAVLSRIGKPISFTVTGFDERDGQPLVLLSRKAAQLLARKHLLELCNGSVIPATVTKLEAFGAFVDIGCGICSMIGIDRISVSRISHPSERFSLGQEIFGVILGQDHTLHRIFLSHRELLGTWQENAELFKPGMTVPGVIRSVKEYGLFVELTPNLSGLAEFHESYAPNARISVYIKSITPERMKCKLLIISDLSPAPPAPLRYFLPETGCISHWQYAPPACSKTGAVTVFHKQS